MAGDGQLFLTPSLGDQNSNILASLEEELHCHEAIRANMRIMGGLGSNRIVTEVYILKTGDWTVEWCLGICLSAAQTKYQPHWLALLWWGACSFVP